MAQHAHDCIYHCFVIYFLLSNFLSNSSCFSNPPFFEDVTRAIAKQIGVCSSALKHAFAFYISANCISLSKLYENDYVKFFKIKGPPLTPLRTICWESIWHVGNLSMYSFIIPSKSKILAILSMWHFRQNSYSKLWPHRPLFPNWHYSLAIATWTTKLSTLLARHLQSFALLNPAHTSIIMRPFPRLALIYSLNHLSRSFFTFTKLLHL